MATGSMRRITTPKGDPRWQITVDGGRDPLTGKRIRSYKTVNCSKREANALMHKMIVEMDKGQATGKKAHMTVGEWIDKWLELYLPNIEETTRIGYKTKIRCYIRPALGDIKLKALRAEHVQIMINDMIERGLSPKNIRDTYNNINAAMKQAVKLRMLPYNPCEGVVLPKRKKFTAKVYDTEMINNLLEVAKGTDMYIPLLIFTMVGLRRGELLALRWEDIDFQKNIIKIRRNMVRGEDGFIIKDPKSEAGIRDIHVGGLVIDALKEYKVYQFTEMTLDRMYADNADYIIRQNNGALFTPDAMSRKWKRFIEKHNLPDIRLHDLRHSNATALIKSGVNPRVVQQRLGHADVSITLNTYTHVLPDMDIEAAEKLDNIFLKKA